MAPIGPLGGGGFGEYQGKTIESPAKRKKTGNQNKKNGAAVDKAGGFMAPHVQALKEEGRERYTTGGTDYIH